MSNIQSKPVPAPKVYIDNFQLKDIQIIAYTLIDEKSVDFSINRDEFETWCEEKELNQYERNIPGNEGVPERDVMSAYDWKDIYDQSYEVVDRLIYDLLKKYIEFLYEPEECSECEGTGETFYSCCGDDLKGTDYEDIGICPRCKEHCCPETCESCGGTGRVMAEPKSISYEEAFAFGDPVACGEDRVPTSEGIKTVPQIMNSLMYGSYSANRGYGMTHDQLIRIGVGNDAMKEKYESSLSQNRN